jgi:hypothetical protein
MDENMNSVKKLALELIETYKSSIGEDKFELYCCLSDCITLSIASGTQRGTFDPISINDTSLLDKKKKLEIGLMEIQKNYWYGCFPKRYKPI